MRNLSRAKAEIQTRIIKCDLKVSTDYKCFFKRINLSQTLVAHTYNPSYLEAEIRRTVV
jgi:hypothetical protein